MFRYSYRVSFHLSAK